MLVKFLIYKNKGSEPLHAGFIINRADSVGGVDKPAVLCMGNKKVKLFA